MDGGTVWNVNLVSAVKRCREQVDDDSQITIDILMCDSPHLDAWTDDHNTLGNYLRNKNIRDYHSSISDVLNFKQGFPSVKFRYFIEPSESLPGGAKMLDFANSTTYHSQIVGRKDGKNAV